MTTVKKRGKNKVRRSRQRPGKKRVPGKTACYAYIADEEMDYIYSLSEKFNQSVSYVLEKIVEAVRKDIVLELEFKEYKKIKEARKVLDNERAQRRRRKSIQV